ncbi:MAG: hypothetical protein EPGJADBJ_01317 [Saprospiraceae bacterium]|nr:hypothetical protein [Saprospiraceae bacterium]
MNLPLRLCVVSLLLLFSALLPAQSSRKIKLTPSSLGFDLPDTYKQRTFIKGLSGFVHKIDQLTGTMVMIDGNKTTVLTRFVRQDKPPVVTTSTSDVIYSAKIDSKFKLNGAYCIASTKIEKDNIYEIILTDVGYSFLPEDYIPYVEICRAATNVAPETRKKTYYIRSAKLTTVYTRAFQKVVGNSEVSGVVFSVGGEVFSSSDQFKLDYIVSVDLVSLEKLLSLQNCNDLINNEEIARREKAEKARLEAMKAEEEKKAREQELAAAKAQVEDLKKTLNESIYRTAEMQRHLHEAQDKERAALEQLNTAIRQANELSAQAEQARQNAESREEVILTFKNKDGKVLEIKNLDELSEDKLRALGFDVEVLRR